MNTLLKKYLRGDATLWVVFMFLCIISAIEMYSASSTLAFKAANYTAPMLRHVGFLGLGALIAFGVHFIPYRYIRLLSYLGLVISFSTLVLVLFKGEKANDASRWLNLFGFQFQPSELAKLSVIIVAADFIARIKDHATDEKKYFRNILILLGAICPLIFVENFSTAVMLFGVVFLMMFIGKISMKRLGILAGVIVGILLLGYISVKALPADKELPKALDRAKTWVNRIDRYATEKNDDTNKYVINDENLQVQQGRIAIARGGVFGVMPGRSVSRDFLPQAYSDFIYAIVVEEMGLVEGYP